MLTTSVLTKASVWYEIGILWANITQVKSHAIALDFWPPSRYKLEFSNEALYTLVSQENEKVLEVKVRGWKKVCRISQPLAHQCRIGPSRQFFSTFIFDLWYFLQLLNLKKVYSTSFERSDSYLFGGQEPKAMAWLSTCVIFAQRTPLSIHT